MPYIKTTWTNDSGEPISATNLNKIEAGVEAGVVHSEATHAPTNADNTATNETSHLNVVVDASYVHTDSNYTADEKTKLAGLESSRFLGEYISLAALNLAHAVASAGDYANVDAGLGSDVERYVWDESDAAFILQLGVSTVLTNAEIKTQYELNADTNAFTDTEKTNLANQSGSNTGDQTLPVNSDFTHAGLTGVDADEHIDWSLTNAKNIHVDNYTDTDTTYTDLNEFTNTPGYITSETSHADVLVDGDTVSPVTVTNKLMTQDDVAGLGGGDMLASVYDTGGNGIVDNAELVNNLTVETAVPVSALFTDSDTVYTHPTTDGNKHVPANSTTNSGKVLTASGVAGTYTWETSAAGVTDHTLLSNIGTNTHAQIDTHIADGALHTDTIYNDATIQGEVDLNTAKISFDTTSSTRLANTSGTNTGDQDLSTYTEQGNTFNSANELLQLDGSALVPSANLPSYVDDVVIAADLTALDLLTFEASKIYVAQDTNITYRWDGIGQVAATNLIVIGTDLALGETISTAYRGDRGVIAYDHSQVAHAPSDADNTATNETSHLNVVVDATYVKTDENYTTAEKALVASAIQTETSYPADALIAQDITDIQALSGSNSGDEPSVTATTGGVLTDVQAVKFNAVDETAEPNDANTTLQGNAFNGINQLVQLNGTSQLPAVDGSLLTNLPGGFADPMTTRGDIIVRDATNTTARLPIGTAGQVPISDGTDITWGDASSGGGTIKPYTSGKFINSGGSSDTSGRLYNNSSNGHGVHIQIEEEVTIDAIGLMLYHYAADCNFVVGIYSVDGDDITLMVQTSEQLFNAAGNYEVAIAPTVLPAGVYALVFNYSGTASNYMYCYDFPKFIADIKGVVGVSDLKRGDGFYIGVSYNAVLPATFTISTYGGIAPIIGLKVQ